MLPTPLAGDWKKSSVTIDYAMKPVIKGTADSLPQWVTRNAGIRHARMDVSLWEWAMAWPAGWTELKPLAMDKFQLWQQQHGESLAEIDTDYYNAAVNRFENETKQVALI